MNYFNYILREKLIIKMEELFNNFANHVGHLISPTLGMEIQRYLRQKLRNGVSPDEYNNIENDIKMIMANYFQNASDQDYMDMSTNLFNAYVENDDENFIKSVKFFIRIYSYYQDINLKKKLFKWRINAIKLKMLKNNNNKNNTIIKSNSSSKIMNNLPNNNFNYNMNYNNLINNNNMYMNNNNSNNNFYYNPDNFNYNYN